MAIKVTCPSCEHRFKVPDEYAGRKGRCPKCKEVFRAPDLDVFEDVGSAEEDPLAGDEWLADELAAPPPQAPAPDSGPRIAASKKRSSTAPEFSGLEDSASSGAAVRLSGPGRSGGKGAARRKRSSAGKGDSLPPWVLPASIGGVVLLLIIGISVAVLLTRSDDTPPSVAQGEDTEQPADAENGQDSGGGGAVEDAPPAVAADPAPQDLLTRWGELHEGVVPITVRSASGTRKTLGFVVDPSGLVIAQYHEVAAPEVESLSVEAGDLGSVGVKGAVAASRDLDLVLLKLDLLVAGGLTSLELAESEPAAQQSLYAASEETGKEGLTPVVVDRVVQSRDLPQSARAVLRDRRIDEANPMYWIETSVPAPAAAVGGPLLDAQGKVLGVNSTLSPSSPHGYAIHARHVAELLEHARDEAVPLAPDTLAQLQEDLGPAAGAGPGDVAQTDPKPPGETDADPGVTPPTEVEEPGETEVADGIAPPTEADMVLSPQGIAHAREVCESFDFAPQSQAAYEWMMLLTTFVNVGESYVENPGNQVPGEVAEQVHQAMADELARLEALEFSEERMDAVNEFAVPILESENGVHVCFYGRVFKDSNEVNLNTSPHAVILLVEGTTQKVILPISRDTHPEFKAGSLWFVLGEYNSFTTFTFGDTGNTERIPLVMARYVIGEN